MKTIEMEDRPLHLCGLSSTWKGMTMQSGCFSCWKAREGGGWPAGRGVGVLGGRLFASLSNFSVPPFRVMWLEASVQVSDCRLG